MDVNIENSPTFNNTNGVSGTCQNRVVRTRGQMPRLLCSACGCTTTLNVRSGGAGYVGETVMAWPNYCANCGAMVKGAGE